MYHPTTRVLAVLELLQSHGRMRGADMADRLGVDARTLRRYIVTLEEIGIPITTERGRHGGYALMPGFKIPPLMFSEDEALALSIGLLATRSLGFAENAPAVVSAQAKLERIMPESLKARVRAVGETVRVDTLRAAVPSDNDALVTLSSAAVAQRRVHMRYRSQSGDGSEREFDPYGLAFRGGAWYAIGWCHLRGEMRSFRLDRIVKAETRSIRFTRPAGFDALAYLRQSMATMARQFPVELFLHADLATASRYFHQESGVFEQADGGVLMRGHTDHMEWYARFLAGLPFDVEVRAPDALQASVARLAERLLRMSRGGAA